MSPPSPTSNEAAADQARWLAQEVMPHEPAIRGYVQSRYPAVDPDDVLQESYLKLLKYKARDQVVSTKAFFFTVVRNTALVLLRRRKFYSDTPVNALPDSCIMEEKSDASEIANCHQRIDLAVLAIESLPPRCREVFRLFALERLSAPEIATRLGITESTVYVHIAAGAKKCREFLRQRGEYP